MKTILITGADGMCGKTAAKIFEGAEYNVLKAGKIELDVTNLTKVRNFFSQKKIDFVLHAAGYTKVDDAESNQELAFLVNAEGAKNVAVASREKLVPIIYLSTDYVFDGDKGSPYLVQDKTNPINVYGASKLLGEKNVMQENPMHYIVRTSWLYGEGGKNFVDTMIALAKSQKVIKVVDDQFGCPTWTFDLMKAIKDLIENKMQFGIYHLCGGGVTSWFEFAKKVFEILKIEVELLPVATKDFPRNARRPSFSAMKGDIVLKNWEDALRCYLS